MSPEEVTVLVCKTAIFTALVALVVSVVTLAVRMMP